MEIEQRKMGHILLMEDVSQLIVEDFGNLGGGVYFM